MSFVARGTKNAFRNGIRTFSIVIILALSTGLALTMLLARQAVETKIDTVKASIGNTITVSPAGARGLQGGGEPLTTANIDTIKSTEHVAKTTETLNDRLTTGTDTSLQSAIEAGSLGRRNNSSGGDTPPPDGMGGGAQPAGFSLPIMVTGSSDPTSAQANSASAIKITSGASFDGTKDANVAIIGTTMATKNDLKVGSTFTAHGETITVVGIYDAGNRFSNGGVIMPLPTAQRLSGQPGAVSSVIVQADSISNVSTTTAALTSKLGDAADVVSQADSSKSALEPLQNIQNIALYSLIGAVISGAVIIFLTMLMIVRERRREIGVFKAIGAANAKIVVQFMSEALTLTAMGAAIGVVAGGLLANSVTNLLVTNSSNAASGGGMRGGPGGMMRAFGGENALRNIHAVVGYDLVLWGLLGAIIIAVVGSAIPAYLTAKIRPAEVMRGD